MPTGLSGEMLDAAKTRAVGGSGFEGMKRALQGQGAHATASVGDGHPDTVAQRAGANSDRAFAGDRGPRIANQLQDSRVESLRRQASGQWPAGRHHPHLDPWAGKRKEQGGDAGQAGAHINGVSRLTGVPRQQVRRQLASSKGRVFNGGQQVLAPPGGAILTQQASSADDNREEIAQVVNGLPMGASGNLEIRL